MKLPVLTKRLKIAGLVSIAGVFIVSGLAAVWYTRTTPEERLYAAIAKDTPFGHITAEKNVEGAPFISDQLYGTPDGTVKGVGSLHCEATNNDLFGTVTLDLSLLQVNTDQFFRFDTLKLSDAPGAQDTISGQRFSKLTGQWIQLEDNDASAAVLQKYHVIFGTTGAVAAGLDGTTMAKKLRDSKAIKLEGYEKTTVDGKAAMKYNLTVSRNQYDEFINSVTPDLPPSYREATLDKLFFSDDTMTTSVVVDTHSGQILYSTYRMPNPCVQFLDVFMPAAAKEVPSDVEMKTTYQAGNAIPAAVKPDKFLTNDQLYTILVETAR